jgi:hypothetical protein
MFTFTPAKWCNHRASGGTATKMICATSVLPIRESLPVLSRVKAREEPLHRATEGVWLLERLPRRHGVGCVSCPDAAQDRDGLEAELESRAATNTDPSSSPVNASGL